MFLLRFHTSNKNDTIVDIQQDYGGKNKSCGQQNQTRKKLQASDILSLFDRITL